MFDIEETGGPLYFIEYVVYMQVHSPGSRLPCILLCLGLICYVSVFLIVYCWALIIFKWFVSYDDGFFFV